MMGPRRTRTPGLDTPKWFEVSSDKALFLHIFAPVLLLVIIAASLVNRAAELWGARPRGNTRRAV
jgi:hypothetical protein